MPITVENLGGSPMLAAAKRLEKRISQVSQLVDAGKVIQVQAVETKDRLKQFAKRELDLRGITSNEPTEATSSSNTPATAAAILGLEERFIGPTNDLLPIEFLEAGKIASAGVGRIDVGHSKGTGFLISPGFVLTNQHVIKTIEIAAKSTFETFVETNRIGKRQASETIYFAPSQFFYTNEDLDFTIVALESDPPSDACGWIPLFEEVGKILIGHSVNLIQHPKGKDKMLVTQNSILVDLGSAIKEKQYCWYTADTEEGSSGSPVFNNWWELIALHHKAIPKTNKNNEVLDINGKTMSEDRYKKEPEMVHWIANEGIRVSRIVDNFRKANLPSNAFDGIRAKILANWAHPKAKRPGKKSGWLS